MINRILLLILTVLTTSCSLCTTRDLVKDRSCLAKEDLSCLREDPDLPDKCLTLDDIIEIVLARNLDIAVKEQEWRVQNDVMRAEALTMLPNLLYDVNYSYRNRNTAATGQFLDPTIPTPKPEFSTEQRSYQWDVTLLWNILDFGISYFRAKQECERSLITTLEVERIRQDLILRAVQAYWRAAVAKKAVEIAEPLVKDLTEQRKIMEKEIKDEVYLSKIQTQGRLASFYQREIQLKGFNDRTDSSDPTQGYEKEYQNSMVVLAQLMQLPQDYPFDICGFDNLDYEVDFGRSFDLDNMAMMCRPELYGRDLEEKIAIDEVYIAILKHFPNLQLFVGNFHDDNKFLVHKQWTSMGTRIAWDLLSWPLHNEEGRIGNDRQELARENRLLIAQGIISEIRIAEILYEQNKEQFVLTKNFADTNAQIASLSAKENAVGKQSYLELLSKRIDAALAMINALKVYAALQSAVEQVNNAIGAPRYFQTHSNTEVENATVH